MKTRREKEEEKQEPTNEQSKEVIEKPPNIVTKPPQKETLKEKPLKSVSFEDKRKEEQRDNPYAKRYNNVGQENKPTHRYQTRSKKDWGRREKANSLTNHKTFT